MLVFRDLRRHMLLFHAHKSVNMKIRLVKFRIQYPVLVSLNWSKILQSKKKTDNFPRVSYPFENISFCL